MERIDAGWMMIDDEPRLAREYDAAKKPAERARRTDHEGRPLTQVTAKAMLSPFGWTTVQLMAPDAQAAAMAKGALVRHDGGEYASIRGGDYGAINISIVVERLTPAGDGIAVLEQAATTSGAKAAEGGQRGETK